MNNWHHLVGVRQGDYIRFYVNGTLANSTFVGSASINNVANQHMLIGRTGAGNYTNAGFDELAIYNRALSASEVGELFGLGCGDYDVAGEALAEGYRYGFQGQEKDDEIKGAGNSINYKYRMHDPRLGRFFAVDPIDHLYPELTPYQHSSLNPIWMLEIEGLEGRKYQTVKKRSKPLINNSLSGGFITRGTFTNFIKLNWHKNDTPEGAGQPVIPPIVPTDNGFEPNEHEIVKNNLDHVYRRDDIELNDRANFKPTYTSGTLNLVFNPGVDKSGNPIEKTYQIGLLDADGNEIIINQVTTDQPGEISGEFDLKEGETLFKREIGEPGAGAFSDLSATHDKSKKEVQK